MAARPPAPEPAAPDAVDHDRFRQVLGRYATGVAVVTTVYLGMDHAMTANALTSVSLDPPLVLVCVETDSRFHEAVVETGFWGVSIMAEPGRARARWLAQKGRPLEGQLLTVPHRRGAVTGAPLLTESVATFECRTTAVHEAGDHHVVIGAVVALDVADEPVAPLLYWAGHYRTLGPVYER
jgi:flavin reductase (DIM6/NTAB) family NADH-FMN oxidoreductase RutF